LEIYLPTFSLESPQDFRRTLRGETKISQFTPHRLRPDSYPDVGLTHSSEQIHYTKFRVPQVSRTAEKSKVTEGEDVLLFMKPARKPCQK